MKTVELDLNKGNGLDSLSAMMKAKNIHVGVEHFRLQVQVDSSIGAVLYAAFLMLLVKYLLEQRGSRNDNAVHEADLTDYREYSYYNFYTKYNDVDKLEKRIEDDFKIDIEVKKKNPVDDAFGIWKGKEITLKSIRTKAWQRTK